MEVISFLTTKGVIEISKNGGYETYSVYLNRRYIGSILQKSGFQDQNENKPTFTEKECKMLVDIALKKVVPKSIIIPIPLIVNGELWEAKMYKQGVFLISNANGMHQGNIWQEIHQGRLVWVSDKIAHSILIQIAPLMLTVKKNFRPKL